MTDIRILLIQQRWLSRSGKVQKSLFLLMTVALLIGFVYFFGELV
jgi:hypothetical protein